MLAAAWIPIVLFAAAQTGRNAAQRSLTASVGTWPATLVRFLFGLPLALALLALIHLVPGTPPALPDFTPAYYGWIALGTAFQIAATAALLLAMETRNFAVAVTLSKTEVLQIALFSSLLLAEVPTGIDLLAMLLATSGLFLLTLPASGNRLQWLAWTSKSAMYGLICGSCFAVATVSFRGAAMEIPDAAPWVSGVWGVFFSKALSSFFLGGWLAWRESEGLKLILRSWRVSLTAGSLGTLASMAWFTAYALQTVAHVRTVGMVEVLFSYLISCRLFQEHIRTAEKWGIALVVAGLIIICLGF